MAILSTQDDLRWIPVRSAAQMLRVTPTRVYQLIHDGQIHAMRVGLTYMVRRQSVEARLSLLAIEAEKGW